MNIHSHTNKRPQLPPSSTQKDFENLIAQEITETTRRLSPWRWRYNQTSEAIFNEKVSALKSITELQCPTNYRGDLPPEFITAKYGAVARVLSSTARKVPDLAKKLETIQECMLKGKAKAACKQIVKLTLEQLAKVDDQSDLNSDELSTAFQAKKYAKTMQGPLNFLQASLRVLASIELLNKGIEDPKLLVNPFPAQQERNQSVIPHDLDCFREYEIPRSDYDCDENGYMIDTTQE